MSTGKQAGDAPHWPLIRVTRLWDVLNRAKSWGKLCEWLFNHTASDGCQMYWPVPEESFVRCSSHLNNIGLGASTRRLERPPLPKIGMPLLEVKFVRLSPQVVQKVAREAASESIFQQASISEDRFLGGLSMMEHFRDASGPYEALPYCVELRITSANWVSTNTWERMEINPAHVYIDDRVYEHVAPLLKEAPNVAIDVTSTVPNPGSDAPSGEGHEVSVVVPNSNDPLSPATTKESQEDAIESDDPYELKGRSDAVYALYLTAARCAQNQAFGQEINRKKRREIAYKVFHQLLDEMEKGTDDERALQKRLKAFLSGERLKHALLRIDPKYDINSGIPKSERVEDWPPAPAKAFLAQPDDRRQGFVTPVLALLITGVQHWSTLMAQMPLQWSGNQQLLLQWLEEYGLVGVQTRETSFEVIVWSGHSVPHAPTSVEP